MLENKGIAVRKNYTLFESDIVKLDYLRKKYKLNASETLRQLINSQYEKEEKEIDKMSDKKNYYKIVVCNLGYNNVELDNLDDKEGTFNQLIKMIKSVIGKGKKEIDGYKITNRNYIETDEETIDIIDTEDFDRGIYLRRIND